MRKIILLLCYFLAWQNIFAQTEKRAKSAQIPPMMIDFIQKNYPTHSKIKFYQEIEHDTLYYEAVFEVKENEYNLLFDKLGNLYETEITLDFQTLTNEIKEKIEGYLKKEFSVYKIKKTQEVDLKQVLMYELAIRAKKQGKNGFYEIYFDRQGNFLKIEDTPLKTISSLF